MIIPFSSSRGFLVTRLTGWHHREDEVEGEGEGEGESEGEGKELAAGGVYIERFLGVKMLALRGVRMSDSYEGGRDGV